MHANDHDPAPQASSGPAEVAMPFFHSIDGATLVVRPLGRRDRHEVAAGFEHLSEDSRRRRFLAGIKHLLPEQLDALCAADGHTHIALVAVELDDHGREKSGVGIAHSIRDSRGSEVAEFAIAIVDDWQGRGVGTLLARALAAEARKTGVARWRAVMFASNVAVRRVLDRVAEEVARSALGDGVVEIVYALAPSAPAVEGPRG